MGVENIKVKKLGCHCNPKIEWEFEQEIAGTLFLSHELPVFHSSLFRLFTITGVVAVVTNTKYLHLLGHSVPD